MKCGNSYCEQLHLALVRFFPDRQRLLLKDAEWTKQTVNVEPLVERSTPHMKREMAKSPSTYGLP